jgi:signal transduction histidine kinase/ActR/RegA family two-component response regulator
VDGVEIARTPEAEDRPTPVSMRGLSAVADPLALLKGIFEHSPVALQVYKADGHCLLVNQAFLEIFGVQPPPEYNVLRDDLLEKAGFLGLVRRAFAGETIQVPAHWYDPRELEQVDVREGRRVGIEVTLIPLRDASGEVRHIATCSKDVTAELELRATLEALRLTEEQLRQSQKMDAVGRLAGGIAHDFNNLLSVILSCSEMLLEDSTPNDPKRGDLEEIKNAGLRAADLTRQMLAFSRQQVLAPKTLDLNEVIGSVNKMLTRVVGEDIEMRSVLGAQIGSVRADPGQIEQVLMNLVVNARDAMPRGGKLTIATTNVELDEAYARDHLGVAPGPYVMLSVSDTGVGMERATQARIFEPFFTTKANGKGTGLGLSTVFGIVKQSGGSVWVYSEPGAGTTFKLYFPHVNGEVESPWSTPAIAIVAGGTETILLVEDDQAVRAVSVSILRRAGYHVLEARGPGEALLLSEQHPVSIQLLVTDVVMPAMGGRQLAERITAGRPTLKVLFMSGYTDDAVLHHGVLESGVAFLQKPLTPDNLKRRVREVLDAPRKVITS